MRRDPDDHPAADPVPLRRRRRRALLLALVLLGLVWFFGSTVISYYVDSLWFDSLGFVRVFWTRLDLQGLILGAFGLATFLVLYGAFLALKPPRAEQLFGGTIFINRQPVRLPIDPVLKLSAFALALLIAAVTAGSMMDQWTTFALYWYAPPDSTLVDPIFGRSVSFYLLTLPAWQLCAGWLLTLAIIICAVAALFAAVAGGAKAGNRWIPSVAQNRIWRGLSLAFAALLLTLALREYLARFELLFQDGTIFSGITYTDAHVSLTGMLVVAIALVVGAVIAAVSAVQASRPRWLLVALVPVIACYAVVNVIAWYVSGFIVKPNQLVRERPFIVHNIDMTRRAYALDRIEPRAFSAEPGVAALDATHNQPTLDNIRLWDWRALQDTLRQIQEIRTYYDFPDIDIDRYRIGGSVRQMMLATRELNVNKLPESSRNWINEKLIYTHGYGITLNPVNGFTSEGLPTLVLSNMPVQSTLPDLKITRPEIYFGELTSTDVYVRTRQKEFNYPQGETNNLTSYEGNGGIRLGGWLRRVLIAFDRGDLTKVPFSDDVNADSRLLMRRSLRERIEELAPFLTLDPDPYAVIGEDGRIYWFIDAYTTSDSYPYARRYRLGEERINYLRNSVKIVIDAYTGATRLYVFEPQDPLISAYRALFPDLFADAASMPGDLRRHVRYPELLLSVQAAVYGLYHMTSPDVFYNREDLWSVAWGIGSSEERRSIEPNFVLMSLPGEQTTEFIEILPFTPANRNNLIGWIAGRSDGEHYGQAVVYDFPKTKLVDGPLQIEARIDQNAELSGQLTLWNQQGSHVRRGSLVVIPIGTGLLYAEPIYLQAERSPMPELRLVVLAVQDRLAYGPTFESALAALFGQAASTLSTPSTAGEGFRLGVRTPAPAGGTGPVGGAAPGSLAAGEEPRANTDTLISEAARDLADYQQLTAEGKLGEAGQKLEALKRNLEELQKRRRH